ncbi:hypothetical protein HYQ45_006134 [Verticillium longisporum]|uniref:Uncharacterized protein n=1 Tax=Verticillium longisporum TaxID=100787 RepID=A0A8I2ZRQ6_VERLO|nr:hypothetical protein HYQ45_006134 [Verticillium longisporum]
MPSQFVIVPATLSPRYQGVEDPTPRQSRLKYLIIASVFLFSIAIAIYCVVGLIYSSQPHFLPATLAVGTGVSVLVIGFILAFLKCWSRVRSRMPAVIPGNSSHGFELSPDEDGSNTGGGYGGFRGWLTMDMPTKIGVVGVEMSNFLSRTGVALFGHPVAVSEEQVPERVRGADACLEHRERISLDHLSIRDEEFGRMSSEERSRTSTPIYTSKGRLRQGSVNKENQNTTGAAGAASNSRIEAVPKGRAASGDVPSARVVGGQSAFAACDQVRKSANQEATTHPDEAPQDRANLPSETQRHLISMPFRGAYSDSASLPKYDPLRTRHEPVSGRLGNLFRRDRVWETIPNTSSNPQTAPPAPAAVRKAGDAGPVIVKRWQMYEEGGAKLR